MMRSPYIMIIFVIILMSLLWMGQCSLDITTCSIFLDPSIESFIGTLHDVGEEMKSLGFYDISAMYSEAFEGIIYIESGQFKKAINMFTNMMEDDTHRDNGFVITGFLLSLAGQYIGILLNFFMYSLLDQYQFAFCLLCV